MRSCVSPEAVSEAMSSEVKLVKSSISALSVAVCLLLPSDVIHSGLEMFSGGFYAAFQLAEQFRICCSGFWSAWEMRPGEAASPGQAALPQDLPLCVACRSQESSVAVGDRENSSGSFLRLACG